MRVLQESDKFARLTRLLDLWSYLMSFSEDEREKMRGKCSLADSVSVLVINLPITTKNFQEDH